MHQFILAKIYWRIYILPKIRHNGRANVPRGTEVAHRSQRNSRSSQIGWYTQPWQRTTLLSDKAVRLSTAKVYVFCDSVLCLGKMHQHPEATGAWKKKVEWFTETPQNPELDRIDGEPIEFEWNIFQGFTSFQILAKIQKMMDEMQCDPEQLTGRSIFMSMYNDIFQ